MAKDTTKKFSLRVKPEFTIELHEKDLLTLKRIQSFFCVGTIITRIRRGKSTAIYSVQSIKNLAEIIIPHFKQYALLTQKRADFELFAKAVDLMCNKEYLHLEGLNKIMSIRASMNKGLTETLKIMFPDILPVERPIVDLQIIKNPL